jgi:hypothetical protein
MHSGSPLPFMTAEATAAQPPIPHESQGIMTRSKTSTLGSATLLSPPVPPAPNPRGGVFQVEPSSPLAVAIPPQPGEMSSLASYLSTTAGIQHDTPSEVSNPFRPVTQAHGRHTTCQSNAFIQPPGRSPVVIVNKFPKGFDNQTLSDDDAKDSSYSAGDLAPTTRGGIADTSTDPTNFQALLDNTWPHQDPDLPASPDPASSL